ncbi:MAG: ATP-binding cassette domain-containing protein, partial [Cyanobium sp.]
VLLGGSGDRGGERKVIDVVKEAASRVAVDGQELSASQLLERFLFPPAQQHQPVAKLSGGERRRLHLCRLLIEAPNVLLLDEPTNDLDVHTLAVLEDFLDDFRGCVVVVSHDRWFLDRTVDRLFCFEGGRLERFEGNYSAYLERQAQREAAQAQRGAARPASTCSEAAPPSPHGAAATTTATPARRRSYRESRELEAIERDLPTWEQRRAELEATLSAPGGLDHGALEANSHELAALIERIAAAEERWLTLSEMAA